MTIKDGKTCFHAETNYFDHQTTCGAPVRWSKYTTQKPQVPPSVKPCVGTRQRERPCTDEREKLFPNFIVSFFIGKAFRTAETDKLVVERCLPNCGGTAYDLSVTASPFRRCDQVKTCLTTIQMVLFPVLTTLQIFVFPVSVLKNHLLQVYK